MFIVPHSNTDERRPQQRDASSTQEEETRMQSLIPTRQLIV